MKNPAIKCYEEEWKSHLTMMVFGILIYLVLWVSVVLYLLWLYSKRKSMRPIFNQRFGCLVIPYHEKMFWWEIVNMFRRAAIVILVDFFSNSSGSILQIFLVLAVCLTVFMLQIVTMPYKVKFLNTVSFLWIVIAIVILFSGIVFNSTASYKERSVFEGLVIFAVVSGILVSIGSFVLELRRSFQMMKEEVLYKKSYLEIESSLNEILKREFRGHRELRRALQELSVSTRGEFYRFVCNVQPAQSVDTVPDSTTTRIYTQSTTA
jgi:hypothetical protein